MVEINAYSRLIESGPALDRVRDVEKLFDDLKARQAPVVLNQVDYSIGFRFEMQYAVRMLEIMGFKKFRSTDRFVDMRSSKQEVRLAEPREGWFPVLYLIH